MKRRISSAEYELLFPKSQPAKKKAFGRSSEDRDSDIRREALERAEEIRRFEIELYWKRSGYFWTIIAAIFAAYGVVTKLGSPNDADARPILLVISCLGLVVSVAWHMVNRGSAAWQRNWETHVDLLEDEITGPLYKTVVDGRASYSPLRFLGPLDVSPSKLTLTASLYVTAIWIALVLWSLPESLLPEALHLGPPETILLWYMIIATGWALVVLLFFCRTRHGDDKIVMTLRERTWG